jgi:2-oxoisovalerate dehydrogenase E1 component
VRLNDPVLIIEHADLYDQVGRVPVNNMDYYVAYGAAKIVRPGTDVTVLTYSVGVHDCVAAAAELQKMNINAEVVDLRTLDYTGMDFDKIGESIRKTHRILIVEQTPRSMGIAARLSDEIQERFFDYLDNPVEKIAAADVPPPVSKALETAMIPSVATIRERIELLATY